MRSFSVKRDIQGDNLRMFESNVLPIVAAPPFPDNIISGVGGGLIYESNTKSVYYNNGTMWVKLLTAGSLPGSANTYSLALALDMSIPTATSTTITGWSIPTEPPFHEDTSQWNLVTGVYTATSDQSLQVNAEVTWDTINLGERTLNVIYSPAVGPTVIAKSSTIQPTPANSITTVQNVSVVVKLTTGDQCYVTVSHNAPTNISILGMNGPTPRTSVSGMNVVA